MLASMRRRKLEEVPLGEQECNRNVTEIKTIGWFREYKDYLTKEAKIVP